MVLTIATLDPSKLTFGVKKSGAVKTDAFFAPVQLDGKPVYVQLAMGKSEPLLLPYGLSTYYDDGDKKRDLRLGSSDALGSWAASVDKTVVKAAIERSKEWFGKKLKESEIGDMYVPLVRTVINRSGESENIRTKIVLEGPWKTHLFVPGETKADTEVVGIEALVPGAQMVPIVKISEVWFVEDKFGVSLDVTQACVWPPAAPSLDNFVDVF